MATMKKLLERIETRLSLAVGVDVQTHAEDRLLELMRQRYELLIDTVWWMIPKKLLTLDILAGIPQTDLTDIILNFYDISTIYLDSSDNSLPIFAENANPSDVQTECYTPSNDPATVFTVLPLTTSEEAHLWYRTRLPDLVWETQELDTIIPVDDTLMITGVCVDYLADDGSNDDALKNLAFSYQTKFKALQKLHSNPAISKRRQTRGGPVNRWY